MLKLSNNVTIPDEQLEFSAIRAQGAGGQHVNKVNTAVQLRFDIQNSSLPEFYRQRLMALSDQRISRDGVIIIKAQQHRSQQRNKLDALEKLEQLIRSAVVVQKARRATKPTRSSQRKRMDGKTARGKVKSMRKKPDF